MRVIIEEMDKVQVLLKDGRKFEVEFWPYDKKTLAITVVGVNEDENILGYVDVGVNIEEDKVMGPDLRPETD